MLNKSFDISLSQIKIRKTIVLLTCDCCGVEHSRVLRSKKEIVDNDIPWKCNRCIQNSQEYKDKISTASKKMWTDGFRKKYQTEEFKKKCSNAVKSRDDKWKNKMRAIAQSEKEERSARAKKQWQDPAFREIFKTDEHRKKMSDVTTKSWNNEEFKNKLAEARSKQPRTSSLQNILYSILDDLGIKYYREYQDKPADLETTIGPWSFDCMIPLSNKKLLIECQGDYWHSMSQVIRKDKAKSTYIERYHPDYEIKYLWEHEFSEKDRIIETIKYWTNRNTNTIDFDFDNIEIKDCPASDYKLLLSKYHYLPNAGRGGISYGAYLNDELIAVCVFSPLVRQNTPLDNKTSRELSRLCIHPKYQKKNFASWLVSRCIKKLPIKYKTIVSYCDTTFNHNGAVYKSCNFRLDGKIKSDYWYVSKGGWVMHKKTLYNHAIKMKMKENEYAKQHGYKKVYGKEKLRFIYERF